MPNQSHPTPARCQRFIGPRRVEYLYQAQADQWEARYPAFRKRGEQQVLERWAGYASLNRVLAWSKAPMLPGKTGDG